MPERSRLRIDREPATLAEARTMVAYNERILQTSTSAPRIHRAERMLTNLRPLIARLEDTQSRPLAGEPSTRQVDGEEFEVVWSGGRHAPSLTGGAQGMGSTLSGNDLMVRR